MSRQKKKAPAKRKMIAAKKKNIGHGIKKAPGKRKILARKEKCSWHKENAREKK